MNKLFVHFNVLHSLVKQRKKKNEFIYTSYPLSLDRIIFLQPFFYVIPSFSHHNHFNIPQKRKTNQYCENGASFSSQRKHPTDTVVYKVISVCLVYIMGIKRTKVSDSVQNGFSELCGEIYVWKNILFISFLIKFYMLGMHSGKERERNNFPWIVSWICSELRTVTLYIKSWYNVQAMTTYS